MRVLVVEDEASIAADIATAVKAAGYIADVVSDGREAWFQGATENYAAIVLDIGLPNMDGFSILKAWRKEGLGTPVIVLTARSSWTDRVDGIEMGADDYLPKPFHMEELLARLRAVMRRGAGQAQSVLTAGPVRLDPRMQAVTVNGVPVGLTPLEFRLLNFLFHHRERVVSHGEISDNIYGLNSERDSNAIEALVRRLRKKLKSDIIETKRGFGYRLSGPPT
jgi:DNA-binding response OmpR family regulator